MKIRFAHKADKQQVLLLLDELIAEVNMKIGLSPQYAESYRLRGNIYEDEIKRKDVKIFVAEDDGTLIGVAEVFIVPLLRRGYIQGVIENFVVTESMRGKGIGTSLLQSIFDYCRKNNIKVVKLNSGVELVEAHRFYEKHGGKFTEKLFRFDMVSK